MTKTKDEILDDIINLQTRIRRGDLTKEEVIAALFYHLYRQNGCPYGDNINGLTMWVTIQIKQFEDSVNTIPKQD